MIIAIIIIIPLYLAEHSDFNLLIEETTNETESINQIKFWFLV